VDEAIISATLELLAERGYGELSLAEVARRAAVGKPALYRRWADKSQLVVEAMASRQSSLLESSLTDTTDTGNIAGDLLAYAEHLAATFAQTPAGHVLPGLVAAIAADPAMAASYRDLLVRPLRERARAAVVRAVARGDLAGDTDVEFVLDALAGPLYVRLLITGEPIDPAYPRAVVDLVLARYATTRPSGAAAVMATPQVPTTFPGRLR
jgi:AcrR family transcriptional regulator